MGAENLWNAGTAVAQLGYDPADEVLRHLRDFKAPSPDSPVFRLDLSRWFNCSVRDEIAGDGKGWLDFGPGFDLRAVQQGDVKLLGVPFFIASRVVMLYAPLPPARGCPKKIENIPIGRKVASVYFVHTLGWASSGRRAPLTYRFHYADGASFSVPIHNRSDIQPWLAWQTKYFEPSSPQLDVAIAWRGATRRGLPVRLVIC